mmetsp:Transcript_23801/g.36488  ORF Transcript_23801/g.36488 Transcript_23801/m.36488 type:complete len:80 (+) Transcript_23801:168-407(+)
MDYPTDSSNPKRKSNFEFEPEDPQGSIRATSDEDSHDSKIMKRSVSPEHQSPPVKTEDESMSSRLIEVLEKEDDLRKTA